jgi:hypothetical protein
MPDKELAARLGATLVAVKTRRFEKGIGCLNPCIKWTATEEALVGTLTDDALAAKLGRTEVAIALKRRALGIPPYKEMDPS